VHGHGLAICDYCIVNNGSKSVVVVVFHKLLAVVLSSICLLLFVTNLLLFVYCCCLLLFCVILDYKVFRSCNGENESSNEIHYLVEPPFCFLVFEIISWWCS
jgi:hypothetical protein